MSNPAKESLLAKYKIWLIPILAGVLLGVIIFNNVGGGSSEASCGSANVPLADYPQPTPAAITPTVATPAVATASATPVKTEATSLTALLPRVELASALQENPFESRISFAVKQLAPTPIATENDPAAAEHNTPDSESAKLASATPTPELETPPPTPPVLNVTGVFRKGGRMAAIIDDRIIFPGESVADGWHLAAIDARGIVLEPDAR